MILLADISHPSGLIVVEHAHRNEPRGVRDVREEDGSDLVGDGTEARVVPLTGIGRGAADDHLGLLLLGCGFHLVHVNAPSLLLHTVESGAVELAAVIDGRTVGEVTAMRQVKPQNRVPWLKARQHHSRVGRSTGVRLNVRPFGAKEFTEPIDRELLNLVHKFAATIVALAWKTLGVFVGQDAALSGHHRFTCVVL